MKTRLFYLRKEAGLTTRELAHNIGYHFSNISMIENEKRDPSPECIMNLCDYFHCSIDYFLCRSDIRSVDTIYNTSEDALKVAIAFDKLTPMQQDIIKNMIKEMRKW